MTEQTCILSTKTLSTAQRRLFLEANLDLLEQDFIEIKTSAFELTNIHDNIIFSSQNAVLSVLENPNAEALKSKNIFCVGMKTRDLLEQNGFKVAVYMDYAAELAEIITLIYNTESYTFFSGNLRKETLPQALKRAKIKLEEIEVYQTKLLPFKISKEEQVGSILFFSPSGVESYLKLNKITSEMCFAIGNTTAQKLMQHKVKNIVIAYQPTVDSLIETAINHFTATKS